MLYIGPLPNPGFMTFGKKTSPAYSLFEGWIGWPRVTYWLTCQVGQCGSRLAKSRLPKPEREPSLAITAAAHALCPTLIYPMAP